MKTAFGVVLLLVFMLTLSYAESKKIKHKLSTRAFLNLYPNSCTNTTLQKARGFADYDLLLFHCKDFEPDNFTAVFTSKNEGCGDTCTRPVDGSALNLTKYKVQPIIAIQKINSNYTDFRVKVTKGCTCVKKFATSKTQTEKEVKFLGASAILSKTRRGKKSRRNMGKGKN
ncbi:uncharacterized protein LOC120347241 isoform X1 [Styela clava]